MIKAGFIVGGTKSSIDEIYAEIALPSNEYGSTVDEIYAEIALPSNEYGSTVDEIYAEISFVSSL